MSQPTRVSKNDLQYLVDFTLSEYPETFSLHSVHKIAKDLLTERQAMREDLQMVVTLADTRGTCHHGLYTGIRDRWELGEKNETEM